MRTHRGFRIVGNLISGYWLTADMDNGGEVVLRIAQANSGRQLSEWERLKEFSAWDTPAWTPEEIRWWIDSVWEYFQFPLPYEMEKPDDN